MSISQSLCLSYKLEIISGIHLASHEYKIALFTNSASLNKQTTSYIGLTNEITNGGYSTGGQTLLGFSTTLINDTAILDFTNDPVWNDASFTARGALIYNNSLINKNSVAVLDFGQDYSCSNGTFTIIFPTPGEATALIRIV